MLKRISAFIISTLIAAGIIIFMLARVWDELLLSLSHLIPLFFLAGVGVCLLAWFVRGGRYLFILNRLHISETIWFSTACIFISQTANLIVPARLGDLVRIFILKHEDNTSYPAGLSSVVTERFFDILSVALLGLLSILYVMDVPEWFYWVVYIPLLLGVVFLLVLIHIDRLSAKNPILAFILEMLGEVKKTSADLKSLIALTFWSLVIWILDIIVCIMVVMMFGEPVHFAAVTLAIVIGNLVKAVPITPGGVGTYELAVALTLELAGISPSSATLIAVIDHLIKNLVTLFGGIASVYYFGDWTASLIKRVFSHGLSREDMY